MWSLGELWMVCRHYYSVPDVLDWPQQSHPCGSWKTVKSGSGEESGGKERGGDGILRRRDERLDGRGGEGQ